MSDVRPLGFRWDGDAMLPLNPAMADRQYVVGEVYRLAPLEERSHQSHAHYFACVTEAWRNLPEDMADRFPTPDHLRKYALIRAGYRNERSILVGSNQEAERMAAFMQPMDEYAIVTATGSMVTVWTAKSQSVRAMGKAEFQASKGAVLEILSTMLGTDAGQLQRSTGQAA